VNYVGRLSNGRIFDQSRAPFEFRLGVGKVIKGWDIGVASMRVGGKRRLVIPPKLGYGASGVPGTIPKNETLTFDVELVAV
jgi:FKBP-type peptidyl-prolyl cis-trans isomerase